MLTVRLTRAGQTEADVKLDQADLRLGRASDNDIELKDPDKTLSRHHAELRREGDRWFYLDLNSVNGSWIGEQRITRQELMPGIAIALGDYELTVVAPAPANVAADAADGRVDDRTFVMRPAKDTVRVPVAGVAPVPASPRAPEKAPAAANQVVGGAVSVSAAPGKHAAGPAPMSPIRRMIIFSAIGVFGAFAIVIALLLRPDPNAASEPAAEQTPAPAAPVASAPAPPASTPEPAPPPAAPPAAAATPAATTASTPPPPAPGSAATANTNAPPPRPAAKARVRDTDPDAAAIPAKAGEDAEALRERREDIRRRYALGIRRLSSQQFAGAREVLADIAVEAPKFRDVAARLVEAEAGVRRQAGEGFKAAAKLEESGEWSDALRAYERLRPFASTLPGLNESIERTRTRMHEAGAEALVRARQFDSRGRVPEAIAWYQRAVNWLPNDHAGLDAARKRLAELKNRQ